MAFSLDDLDRAVRAGAIDATARDRLAEFLAREDFVEQPGADSPSAGADAENFRLLTGFNDIFVALAIVLLLAPLAFVAMPWGAAAGLALAWGLSEFFIRRRRMALPAIILLGATCLLTFAFVLGALTLLPAYQDTILIERIAYPPGIIAANPNMPAFFEQRTQPWLPAVMAVAAALAVGAATLHWLRFRVPVTIAAGCLAIVASLGFTLRFAGVAQSGQMLFLLLAGVLVFALAMRFDMKDRSRSTRYTDIAFWLHLLAAPLIVHPLFQLLGTDGPNPQPWAVPAVIGVFLMLVLLSLTIDRRAFLVASLIYVLGAIGTLFSNNQAGDGFILTALVLGGFLVSLSAAWGFLRRSLLPWLPPAIRAKVPAPAPG